MPISDCPGRKRELRNRREGLETIPEKEYTFSKSNSGTDQKRPEWKREVRMVRTFLTHRVRRQTELSGRLWRFEALEGDRKGEIRKAPVPGCWETWPGFENYRGWAAYETEFAGQGNIRIEFKGVSHMAKVSVDGKEAASHYNSYTPFSLVVPACQEGMHRLRVLVDNSYGPEYSLDRDNDYMSYGGISRGVVAEEVPDVYLEGIHVTPLKETENGWLARVEVFCTNLTEAVDAISLEIALHDTRERFEVSAAPGKSRVLSEEIFFAETQSWDTHNPALYEISAVLYRNGMAEDDLIDRVGFRTIRVEGNRILLNGKPIHIRGFCRHEAHPDFGCALPFEMMAYDLELLRDMGANSVRTSHYPNDERFLDLCDEMGILVWEENHARGLSEEVMRNPLFEPQAEEVIREMITAHYNHPSIYIWGILNECASDTAYGRECYEKQYALIRELDCSRPCSSASCKFGKDICLDLPDVVSWNIYPYWYEEKTASEKIDELYRWTGEKGNGGGKPFLITETGAGAIYGFRSPDHDKWTEEYQAEALRNQITEILSYEDCMGVYIWQFCDVRVGKGWFAHRPGTRNNKGVVDEFRRRKMSYDVVKELFTGYAAKYEKQI